LGPEQREFAFDYHGSRILNTRIDVNIFGGGSVCQRLTGVRQVVATLKYCHFEQREKSKQQ
jgi:hypothetical protein